MRETRFYFRLARYFFADTTTPARWWDREEEEGEIECYMRTNRFRETKCYPPPLPLVSIFRAFFASNRRSHSGSFFVAGNFCLDH